ncbi:MAG: hypothetical protein MR383_01545 [Lachnospiraceae bacterium]|nr:hypothetical protein [Lachnospiraceae bacterium]
MNFVDKEGKKSYNYKPVAKRPDYDRFIARFIRYTMRRKKERNDYG